MRFKVVSINLWWGGKLWEGISDFLMKERPDILACQEVHLSQDASLSQDFHSVAEIKKVLPHLAYSSFAPAFHGQSLKGPEIVSGNAILSRFEMSDASYEYFQNYSYGLFDLSKRTDSENIPRNLQHVRLDIDGTKYELFNTQGIWGRDNGDTPEKIKMAKKIALAVAGKKNCFLCGDFNIDMKSESISLIEKAGLVNLFKGKISTSFNMDHKDKNGQYASSVVDSIFASPDIKIISAECPAVNISDHLPQVVVFEI